MDQKYTNDVYERAGMKDNPIGFGDSPAIVAIDIQKGMTDPDHPIGSDLSSMVEYSKKVIEAAHDSDVPVIFTREVTKHPNNDDLGIFGEKIPTVSSLTPESKWTNLDSRLPVKQYDHIIDKTQPSGFHGTELNTMLSSMNIDTTVILGASTSGCVRATVYDSSANGYRTIVPEEAVGDRSSEQHKANLFDIDAKLGDVVSVTDVISYLEQLN